jgi:predicted amidohydrolase
MHICLIPLKTEPRHPAANLEQLAQRFTGIEQHQPDLVCLPECTLTGYLYHEEDFERFAEPVPGPVTDRLGQLARDYSTYLCFGLLEVAAQGVYNSAVLLDRAGEIVLHHRKIEEKPPFVNGTVVNSVRTEIGRLCILVCGDLFNTEALQKLDPSLDLLLMPMSRAFAAQSPDADRWISEERQAYLDAVKAAGITTLVVNALEINHDEPSFGGALVVSDSGELLAESPHGTDEVLVWDFRASNHGS